MVGMGTGTHARTHGQCSTRQQEAAGGACTPAYATSNVGEVAVRAHAGELLHGFKDLPCAAVAHTA